MKKLSRMQTIRKYCVWCCNDQLKLIRECSVENCALYSRRSGHEDKSVPVEKRITAKQATRARCLDCSGNNMAAIKLCPITGCILWPWRMGKSPYSKQS
jgi:hypothetical protein